MSKPWRHRESGTFYLRIAVPADLKAKARGKKLVLTVEGRDSSIRVGSNVKVTLRTKNETEAKKRFIQALAQVETFWSVLRNGPVTLSTTQRRAIAGDVYAQIVGEHRDEPGEESQWTAHRELMERYLGPEMRRDQRLSALDLLAGIQTDEAISRRGLRITDDSRMDLLEEVGRAMSDGFGNLSAMARIDYSERRFPKWDAPSPEAAPMAAPITFKDIIDEEVKARSRGLGGAALREKTVTKFRREVKSFTDHRDNEDALTVTEAEIVAWVSFLLDEGDLSRRTVANAIGNLRTVWGWGRKRHRREFPAVDPFEHVERPSFDEVPQIDKSFTIAEAQSVLKAALGSNVAETRWLPWLCAFSGARISEVSALRGADFFMAGGRHFFKLTATGGRTLKTRSSERRMPLHPELVRQGFLTFVQQTGSGPLFVKRAHQNVGDWVRKTVGIARQEVAPNHGWRHLFEDLLTNAGVPDDARAYLTGRATGSSRDRYGRSEAMLPGLAREMDKVQSLLDWNEDDQTGRQAESAERKTPSPPADPSSDDVTPAAASS